MSTKQFKQGDTVYSEHGQAAEYVAKITEGHIVRPQIETYEGDSDETYTHLCAPETWVTVFSEPPTEKYHAELKALHEKIAEARATRSKEEAADRERIRVRNELFKKFDALQGIEDFIAGKITHYVQPESYGPPKVIAVTEAIASESDYYRKKLRLVTLGGELCNGEISWTIGQYSDCSGGQYGVIPCASLEQAEELVRNAITKHFAMQSPDARQGWIDAADKYSITVPQKYRLNIAKSRLEHLVNHSNSNYVRQQIATYNKQLTDTEAEIATLRAMLEESATVK